MSGYDAIIVGTRCAGAALALLLARKGYRVLGIDRAHFPSDTLSTHFLPPRTTHFLECWGLLGRPDAVDGTAAMYGPRRTVLDALLVQAAREAGAELREGVTLRDLLWEG